MNSGNSGEAQTLVAFIEAEIKHALDMSRDRRGFSGPSSTDWFNHAERLERLRKQVLEDDLRSRPSLIGHGTWQPSSEVTS